MNKFHFYTPYFLVFICFSFFLTSLTSQHTLKGVILRYDKPEKNVKVSVEGFKSTADVLTDTFGNFSIIIPEGGRVLEFQEKGNSHMVHLKLNPKIPLDL